MVAEIHQLRAKPVAINWMCSSCGVDAGCNCGAPLMSKLQRAKEAITANPQRSDRAIADEIGASHTTVQKARRETGNQLPVDEEMRIGLDGKHRRMPTRQQEPEDDNDDFEAASPSELRASFLIFSNEALLMARYEGPIDQDVLRAARETAAAWCRLVETMEQGK